MAKIDKRSLTKEEFKKIKSLKSAEKEYKKIKNQIKNSNEENAINILCVRFGNKYSIEYVKRLRNMVSRNISIPYKFFCLTDDPTPIDNVINIVRPNKGYTKGWWHKVHMFDPGLPIEGRILYFDLDVIIHNNIDKLCLYLPKDFVGIRDFNRKFHPGWKNLNSSVMSWNHKTQSHVWNQFNANSSRALRLHGDQDWIWQTCKDRLKFFPDPWIQSYKWEIRKKEELYVVNGKRNFRTVDNDVSPGPECSIAVFHGDPNPESVKDKFVVDNWK